LDAIRRKVPPHYFGAWNHDHCCIVALGTTAEIYWLLKNTAKESKRPFRDLLTLTESVEANGWINIDITTQYSMYVFELNHPAICWGGSGARPDEDSIP
jgi:hypothetical protein